jgi:hypothetical protein
LHRPRENEWALSTAQNKIVDLEEEAWPRVVDGKLTFPASLEEHFPSIVRRLETLDAFGVEHGLAPGESIDLLRIFLVIDKPNQDCLTTKIKDSKKAEAFFAALDRLFIADAVKVS